MSGHHETKPVVAEHVVRNIMSVIDTNSVLKLTPATIKATSDARLRLLAMIFGVALVLIYVAIVLLATEPEYAAKIETIKSVLWPAATFLFGFAFGNRG